MESKLDERTRRHPWENCLITDVIVSAQVNTKGCQISSTINSSNLIFLPVFVSIASSCVVSLGHYPYSLMLQCFLASFLFYSAHWQTYVTGTMRFGKFDVTEGQMSVMAMMFATAIFGPQLWDISVVGVSFRYLPSMFAFTMGCIAFLGILNKISDGGVGRNGSTVAVRRSKAVSVMGGSDLMCNDDSRGRQSLLPWFTLELCFSLACMWPSIPWRMSLRTILSASWSSLVLWPQKSPTNWL